MNEGLQGIVLDGYVGEVNFDLLVRVGIAFAFVHVGRGLAPSFRYAAQLRGAANSALPSGVVLELDPSAGLAEQAALLARLGATTALAPAVSIDASARTETLSAFRDAFRTCSQRRLLVRAPWDARAKLSDSPWIVHEDVRAPSLPQGVDRWTLWTGHRGGPNGSGRSIGVKGPVERVVFRGDLSDLLKEAC